MRAILCLLVLGCSKPAPHAVEIEVTATWPGHPASMIEQQLTQQLEAAITRAHVAGVRGESTDGHAHIVATLAPAS